MPTWLQVLSVAAALVGGLTGVAALISAIGSRRTLRASARKTDVEALALTIETQQSELRRLYKRLSELEKEQEQDRATITALRARIEQLTAENDALRDRVEELERENRCLRGDGATED